MYKDMYDAYCRFAGERQAAYRTKICAATIATAAADEAAAAAEDDSSTAGSSAGRTSGGGSSGNVAPSAAELWGRMLSAFSGNRCAHASWLPACHNLACSQWQTLAALECPAVAIVGKHLPPDSYNLACSQAWPRPHKSAQTGCKSTSSTEMSFCACRWCNRGILTQVVRQKCDVFSKLLISVLAPLSSSWVQFMLQI